MGRQEAPTIKWGIVSWKSIARATYLVAICGALFAVPASATASPAPLDQQTSEIPVGFDAVNGYTYEGETVSAKVVHNQELACVQTSTANVCFDDEASAEAAFAGTEGSAKGAQAAQACAVTPLWEYKDIDYNGEGFSLFYIGAYIDYNSANNNTTTSFQSGKASSIFADYQSGGGPKYTGQGTGYCGYQDNLRPTNWNNRFSSRARLG